MTENDTGSSGPDEKDLGQLQRTDSSKGTGLVARGALGVIRFYQRAISPLFPPSCRFSPTCSEYTKRAVAKYGFWKGCWLGLKRVLKCHPFHSGGSDPVP